MACFHPLRAFRGGTTAEGKVKLVWRRGDSTGVPVYLPCGQCVGCRLERSRQWAIRCMHEASLYDVNCFITLTYDPANIPKRGSLCLRDFQNFMKRLRKRAGRPVRFYHCGEYGKKYGRPHYHALLFNWDFADKVLAKTERGVKLYESKMLDELWPFGLARIGALTFESAAYTARYVVDKIDGERAEAHYGGRKAEYATMSRRPGIGREWFARWAGDVFPSDEVVVRGRVSKPPRYYDGLLESSNPGVFGRVKEARKKAGNRLEAVRREVWRNGVLREEVVLVSRVDPDRLADKELVKKSAMSALKRALEE